MHTLTLPPRSDTPPRLPTGRDNETELIDATALRLPTVGETMAVAESGPAAAREVSAEATAIQSWTVHTPSGKEAKYSFNSSRFGSSRRISRSRGTRSSLGTNSTGGFAANDRNRGMSILDTLAHHHSSFLDDDDDDSMDGRKSKERDKSFFNCCKSIRFVVKSAVQVAHFCLSITALWVFARDELRGLFATQALIILVDSGLSILVTFSDLDVRRWVQIRPGGPPSCLRTILVGFLFGLLQLIHVKRAWARQIHVAEVLSQLQDKDLGEEFLWTGPALGGEGAYPVNFLTGIFSALISNYAYLTVAASSTEEAIASKLILAYGVSSVIIVALCVVELDLAVSNYVNTRYHFNSQRKGTRVGHLQVFFPVVHLAFRITEVMMRALLISMIVVFLTLKLQHAFVAAGLVTAFFLFDYVLGVLTLRMFSPEDETLNAHMLVGVALMLSNMTRLIDVPGFCRPAQLVSRFLEAVRFTWLFSWVAVFWIARAPTQDCDAPSERCVQDRWVVSGVQLCIAATIHYVLRCAFFQRNGDDLHSCVVLGKHRRLKKLLDLGMNGEALDINGYMKDRKKRTPAMLAAKRGDLVALELLFSAGARVQPADLAGNTCLHYAVQYAELKALEFMVEQNGAVEVLRKDGGELQKLVVECVGGGLLRNKRNQIEEFSQVLVNAKMNTAGKRGGSTRSPGMASIRPTSVGDQMLNSFFPGAMKEEMPKMQELRSVCGLVIAHALGPLARIFFFEKKKAPIRIASMPAGRDGSPKSIHTSATYATHVSLERLTKTKVIGQGGYASVIEVEERLESDADNSGSFVRALSSNVGLGWLSSFTNMSQSQSHASQSMLHGEAPPRLSGRQPSLLPSSTGNLSGSNASTTLGAMPASSTPTPPTPRKFAMKLQAKNSVVAGFNVAAEALALQRIQHPFIVRLEHAFQTPQFYALVLEFCPGGDLNKLLVREADQNGYCPGLPALRSARYCGQVLLALAHLHKVHGLVYRDMKPDNVLISAADEAKLADFGLVSYVGKESKSKRMSLAGTKGFAAPELITGNIWGDEDDSLDEEEIDPFLTDSFSFGVTLEVVLLGEDIATKVFEGDGESKSPKNSTSDKSTVWLVPQGSTDDQLEGMQDACDRGRISPEAVELIVGLIQVNTTLRRRILDPWVLDHPFFLKTLEIDSLEELMMAARQQQNQSPSRVNSRLSASPETSAMVTEVVSTRTDSERSEETLR